MGKYYSNKMQLVKTFIDNTPVAYIILDKNYQIHYINQSFADLRKLDMKKTIGNKCYNISNGGVPCPNCAVAESLKTGKKAFISRKDILPDNTIRFIDDYAIPIGFGENGEVEYILEIMLNRTEEMLKREQRNKDYDEILSIFTTLLEAKDSYTAAHSDNVRKLSLNLAIHMGLKPEEVFEIAIAASLHDIGKVDIPDSIINKQGKLTKDEYETIKNHPVMSYKMLQGLSSFDKVKDIALHHHERVDGAGYPKGLSKDNITLGAKIIAVADTYDAITTTRSYRKAQSHEYALSEIKRVAGTQLDEKVVEQFLSMDFENMTQNLYEQRKSSESKPIERKITGEIQGKIDFDNKQSLHKVLDQKHLLSQIFAHTPYGYILMDKTKKVIFASDYFLDYMGLEKQDVIGKPCYKAKGIILRNCHNCVVDKALKSQKTEYIRQEQITSKGLKIFDSYAVALVEENQKIEYVIEIIMDRTEEILQERAKENDIKKLIEMLGEIFEKEKEEIDSQKLSKEIISLKNRLYELISKNTLEKSRENL